jgi:flagellar basal body-associated protein FliL
MKKMIMFGGIGAVVLLAGGGGTFAFLEMGHKSAGPAKPVAVPPKPIVFAALPDLVVSIPDDTGDPPSSYVQLTLQFATTDPNAVTAFTNLQPIIKAQIISLLMNETGKTLADPAGRDTLTKNCLAISNTVLTKSAGYTPANPFSAAYITNLVVQN